MTKHYHTKKFGALEFKKLNSKKVEYCINNHYNSKQTLKKSGYYSVYILNYPVGSLCYSCAKEWVEIWKENSGINIAGEESNNINLSPAI